MGRLHRALDCSDVICVSARWDKESMNCQEYTGVQSTSLLIMLSKSMMLPFDYPLATLLYNTVPACIESPLTLSAAAKDKYYFLCFNLLRVLLQFQRLLVWFLGDVWCELIQTVSECFWMFYSSSKMFQRMEGKSALRHFRLFAFGFDMQTTLSLKSQIQGVMYASWPQCCGVLFRFQTDLCFCSLRLAHAYVLLRCLTLSVCFQTRGTKRSGWCVGTSTALGDFRFWRDQWSFST